MGRKKLYNTDEERLAAKRLSARKSYQKKKLEKDEFNRLLRINPDLYTSKRKMTNEQKQFIKTLLNLPLDTKPPIKRTTRLLNSIAKQQLGLANTKIRNKERIPIKTIDFDLTLLKTEQERQYFFEHLPDVIYKLLDSIHFNTEHWVVHYTYKNSWKSRTLDEITEQHLRDQVKHDLQEHLHSFIEYNEDYDFFVVMIQQLTSIRFINIDQMKKASGSSRKKREGKFWRWLLKGFNEINLERFMIFHRLDKHAVELINRDNCFVYACAMSGLSDALLNDLRYSIKKRSLTHHDVHELAKEYDLKIHIKELEHSYFINPSGSIEVRLVLLYNHYMIDEKVNVSPYYILHKKEIMNDRITRYWKQEDKMKIVGKSNGYYIKSSSNRFSLRKVISALFQVNAFEPITMNDYRAYASLVCFENIDPIKKLEYDERFCCRLKKPLEPKTNESTNEDEND